MAFTDLGSLGATGATTNNQTTLDLTTALTIAAGSFAVVVVAADNIANGGDDNAVSSVTLGTAQAPSSGKGSRLRTRSRRRRARAARFGTLTRLWLSRAAVSSARPSEAERWLMRAV